MKFPFFSRKPVEETKTSAGYRTHYYSVGEPVWSKQNYQGFSTEGYGQNSVVYQAVRKIATAIASIEWQAWAGDDLIQNHPIIDLMKNPNPIQSGREWWETRVSYLLLQGNCYDEGVVDIMGSRLLELWTLRPDRMSVIPSSTGLPKAFQYKGPNGKTASWPSNPITGESAINHTKLFSPLDDTYGQSPLAAGSRATDVHNETLKWMAGLLQNSARPSGALTADKEMSLTDEEFRRITHELEQRYSGSEGAGRPMLLEGGLDWKPMGMTPDDMTLNDTKDSVARDISLAFGVPPLLLNIPGDNTYSNYGEARIGFYQDTVIPLAWYLIADLNKWLKPYLDGAEIRPNLEDLEAVAKHRRELWEMVDASDEITVNEARKLKGLPPLPDKKIGDMLMADLRASRRGHTEDEPNQPSDDNSSDGDNEDV